MLLEIQMLEGEDIPGERALPTPVGVSTPAVAPPKGPTERTAQGPAAAGIGTLLEQWLLPERELPQPN